MAIPTGDITLDIIEGDRGRKTLNGWELDRIATITGVSGEGYEKVINATEVSGMPEIGDEHPARDTCLLREMIPELLDPDTVKLRLVYKDPDVISSTPGDELGDPPRIECGATASQVETNKDYGDNDFEVTYTYPADYEYDDDLKSVESTTGATVSKLIPETTIQVVRKEIGSPTWKARNYVGKVNSGGWTYDTGASSRTWMCAGIVGRSAGRTDAGQIIYDVTYTFQYRPDTWDTTIMFIDRNTGKPPSDLIADTGIKTYQLYETTNFNSLRLT